MIEELVIVMGVFISSLPVYLCEHPPRAAWPQCCPDDAPVCCGPRRSWICPADDAHAGAVSRI